MLLWHFSFNHSCGICITLRVGLAIRKFWRGAHRKSLWNNQSIRMHGTMNMQLNMMFLSQEGGRLKKAWLWFRDSGFRARETKQQSQQEAGRSSGVLPKPEIETVHIPKTERFHTLCGYELNPATAKWWEDKSFHSHICITSCWALW